MMKNILTTVLSLVAVFTLFIGSPANIVQANEVNSTVELQQDSKFVEIILYYGKFPPDRYYFNDGYYQGYIPLVSNLYVGGQYRATYAGTVYRSSPIEQVVPEI